MKPKGGNLRVKIINILYFEFERHLNFHYTTRNIWLIVNIVVDTIWGVIKKKQERKKAVLVYYDACCIKYYAKFIFPFLRHKFVSILTTTNFLIFHTFLEFYCHIVWCLSKEFIVSACFLSVKFKILFTLHWKVSLLLHIISIQLHQNCFAHCLVLYTLSPHPFFTFLSPMNSFFFSLIVS